MKANDILGLGKVLPIDKLFDIVSKSVGRLSKPYFDRKDIDTEAYKIKKLAEARAVEMKIISTAVKENFQLTGGIEYNEDKLAISSPKELLIGVKSDILIAPPIEQRAQERLDFQEVKKQLNIESVTGFAAEELKDETPITDEQLDADWTTRFFRIAEDISNEEMQQLWGRILAGEVRQPKSYSLRTLELLKNLSKEEADVFTKFAQIALNSNTTYFVLDPDKGKFLQEEFGIQFTDKLLLVDVGLIVAENNLEFSYLENSDKDEIVALLYGEKGFFITRKKGTPKQALKVIVFTKPGIELLKLVDMIYSEKYIDKIANSFKSEKTIVKFGDILHLGNGQLQIFNEKQF